MKQTMQSVPKEELEAVVKVIVEKHVSAAILEFVRKNEDRAKELSLIERVVRVEEELKSLREIEAVRFEAMEKQFDALHMEMDKRFEGVDKRLDALHREMDTRFAALHKKMDARFTPLDKRLVLVQWAIRVGLGLLMLLVGLLRIFGG